MTGPTPGASRAMQEAGERLRGLPPAEREALLVRCWMSHDTRWFMVVAAEFGLEAANRLNQRAAHELGKVEAQRIRRAVGLPPVRTAADYACLQDALAGIIGPDLLDYTITPTGEDVVRIEVRRCFAHDNVVRAEVAAGYRCGIFARITGWLEGFGLAYEVEPPVAGCLPLAGRACAYTLRLRPAATVEASGRGREPG